MEKAIWSHFRAFSEPFCNISSFIGPGPVGQQRVQRFPIFQHSNGTQCRDTDTRLGDQHQTVRVPHLLQVLQEERPLEDTQLDAYEEG